MRLPENAASRSPDPHLPKRQMNGVGAGHVPNGVPSGKRDYQNAPEEPLQLVEVDHFLPVATLVSRSAQACWNDLYELVEQLSSVEVPAQPFEVSRGSSYAPLANNQTKANLDKKDRILNFANDQKANFIKLMVLLQWSQNVKDVSKTISLNFWLHQQREQYNLACFDLYMLKTEATEWQLPNPDIDTAGQVLALGKVPSLPHLGYRPIGKLSKRQIISTLRRLNNLLTSRLTLEEEVPASLRNYYVHDGRVTFRVPDEFEVDLSVLEDKLESPYRMVDIRFLFTPRPSIPEELRMELERLTDLELGRTGLSGCYAFLHELTLSNKLAEYHKQALSLSRQQWAGQIKVELLHRNLIIQYWTERPLPKSWVEIGIYSQRKSPAGASRSPTPGIRWFREGKRVEDFEVDLDPSILSLVSILSQLISQHIAHALDLIYDKLAPSALFGSGALALEESISYSRPEECSLEIQTTKDTNIKLTIEPVTGLMVVSPASEKTNRLQLEINRSKNVVEDFVPKFLNFRCAVAEAQILAALRESSWQGMFAFKPTLADLRTMFGPSVARASFLRHPLWSQGYLLVITYRPTGDALNLIEMPAGCWVLTSSRIVHTQPIHLDDDLSPMFFESYADYASGVVVLDNLSQEFKQTSYRHKMPALPDFRPKYTLPALSLDTTAPSRPGLDPPSTEAMVKIRFVRMDAGRQMGRLLVQLKCHVPDEVLKQLTMSSAGSVLSFTSKDRQISFHVDVQIGRTSTSDILQHVKRLTDVIACVQVVEKFNWLRLASVSIHAVTLKYHFGDSVERELKITFQSTSAPAQVEFLPRTSNPHAVLGPAMSQQLQDIQTPFASHLRTILASLSLINPILDCLNDLQHPRDIGQEKLKSKNVRIHLLVRQPTMLALQFYAMDPKRTEEGAVHGTSRLLARFEILPFQSPKSSFVLRPAQEELKSYKRASFASDIMRGRVKEQIFQMADKSEDWMRFDSAAVFLADRPRPLLEALYKLMDDFAQIPTLAIKDDTGPDGSKAAQPPTSATPRPNGNTAPKTVPKTPQQGQRNIPNGVNSQRPKAGNKPSMNTQGKEVITLD